MKKLLIVFILFPVCFLYWCEKQVSEDLNVEKSAIIQYCESNGWFIAETDTLVCFFLIHPVMLWIFIIEIVK